MTLRPLKTLVLCIRELGCRKTKVWDLKMPFKVFWGSLGLLFGAPGGLLGALLVLLGRLDGTPNVSNVLFGHP